MKKILSALIMLLGFLNGRAQVASDTLPAETLAVSPKSPQNRFVVLGNAEMKYSSDKETKQFIDVNFKPIFLWKISDKLFVEAEPEFETGGGSLDIGLEYVNMVYIANRYLMLHAGRFLPKFGSYRGRMGEAFINRFASDPVGFGDGGIGAMNEVGIGAQGGIEMGSGKINYDLYVSEGPQLLTDAENSGQFDYEAYVGNNNGKAVGGRVGILPFPNSSLELGYSFQSKSHVGAVGSIYENTSIAMQAVDLNFYHNIKAIKSTIRILGEWKYQKVGDAMYYKEDSSAYTFKNNPQAYYLLFSYRPSLITNKFFRNVELAVRYSNFKRPADAPWGGGTTEQTAFVLDYWLKWNSVIKFSYQKQTSLNNAFTAQVVFGF
jgi:hypothetical protein